MVLALLAGRLAGSGLAWLQPAAPGQPQGAVADRRSAVLGAASLAVGAAGLVSAPAGASAAASTIPDFQLADGMTMPAMALNTAGLTAEQAEAATSFASSLGIRHIDFHPGRERDGVARVLAAKGRDSLFLTTKIAKFTGLHSSPASRVVRKMALPPVLSEQGLARFRTKPCERLVVSGGCTFGARCQYSHDAAWMRRNPRKRSYRPQLCADLASGCARGADCGFAHSEEEVLFHPLKYKTVFCEAYRPSGGEQPAACASCETYYCPYAHRQSELRLRKAEDLVRKAEETPAAAKEASAVEGGSAASLAPSGDLPRTGRRRRGGRRSHGSMREVPAGAADAEASGSSGCAEAEGESAETQPPPPQAEGGSSGAQGKARKAEGSASQARLPVKKAAVRPSPSMPGAERREEGQWWVLDGQLRVAMVPEQPADAEEALAGQALAGGRRSPGELRRKGSAEVARCEVKLVPAGRLEHVEAARIVKELRRWMAFGGEPRAHDIRRTVATVCLALPLGRRPLGCSLKALGGSLAERLAEDWRLCGQVGTWVQQLLSDLQLLHEDGTAHLCISPATVLVHSDGSLELGDFLGKIRILSRLARGWEDGGRDDAWAMWHPAEVHKHIQSLGQEDAEGSRLTDADHFAVDLWQLGVTIFFMLTGRHLFGDLLEPAAVCENVLEGRPVNLPLLAGLPLFADLVTRLTAAQPRDRPQLSSALGHPVCWPLARAAAFSFPAAADGAASGLLFAPPGLDPAPAEAQRSSLRHLPCLAPLGGPAPPAAACEPLLRALRARGGEAVADLDEEDQATDCPSADRGGEDRERADSHDGGRAEPSSLKPKRVEFTSFDISPLAQLRTVTGAARASRRCASVSPAGSSTSSTTASCAGSPTSLSRAAPAELLPVFADFHLEEPAAAGRPPAVGGEELLPLKVLLGHLPLEEPPSSLSPLAPAFVRTPPGLRPPPGLQSPFQEMPVEFLLDAPHASAGL